MMSIEEEEIEILSYVLSKEISERRLVIDLTGKEPEYAECYYLRKEGGEWTFYYAERGERNSLSRFANVRDAFRFAYWTMSGTPSHRAAYRELRGK